jgi:hypothetical protein
VRVSLLSSQSMATLKGWLVPRRRSVPGHPRVRRPANTDHMHEQTHGVDLGGCVWKTAWEHPRHAEPLAQDLATPPYRGRGRRDQHLIQTVTAAIISSSPAAIGSLGRTRTQLPTLGPVCRTWRPSYAHFGSRTMRSLPIEELRDEVNRHPNSAHFGDRPVAGRGSSVGRWPEWEPWAMALSLNGDSSDTICDQAETWDARSLG